jgi:MFS family permease
MFFSDVNFHNILISRVVAGFGMGILYLLIPVYLHELTSNEYKLMAENILSVAFAFGILFQYSVGEYFCYFFINLRCFVSAMNIYPNI